MSEVEYLYNLFTFCLTILFSSYLFINGIKERPGNIGIGFFICYMGLESLDALLVQSSFYLQHPNLYLLIPSLGLLLYPAFYYYIKSTAFIGTRLKWIDLIHLAPFVIIWVILLAEYYLQPVEVKLQIMTHRGEMPWFISMIYYALRIQGLIYMVLSVRVILRFRAIVREHYSTKNKRNYTWLLQLTIVFVYYGLSTLIFNINRFGVQMLPGEITYYISASVSLIFIIWIIYKALSQPYLFNGVDANIKLLKEYLAEKKKNHEFEVKAEDTDQDLALRSKLDTYMATEEVFLDPSLTIFELAKGIGLTSAELSLFLNKNLGKNFFEFINEYRIERAKKILEDPDKKQLTILEILYAIGFNSKSSFNTAFKKHVGKTPTEYRKEHVK
ncbi:helix-turn-helix domain-containing protein [Robertkochia flava]|uniref:helix-turn-helix domain-containing protein n=1 Tax=Robertkochia flava TaxID=3447986 RepID=UPI001CCC2331|nr:helix-turn-helix domain-containing protein [Robertkochia marina]